MFTYNQCAPSVRDAHLEEPDGASSHSWRSFNFSANVSVPFISVSVADPEGLRAQAVKPLHMSVP